MTGHGANVPAGWYPVDDSHQRYWDGVQWTEHVHPLHPAAPQTGQAPQPGTPYGQAPQPGTPYGQAPNTGSSYGQAPQPGSPYGQAPQPGPFNNQAPFVGQQQSGWQNSGWQDAGPAPFAQTPVYPASGQMPLHSTPNDRTLATVTHLLGLVAGFLGPLIVWIVKKEESPYVAQQAKEALNFQLTMILYWVVSFFAMIILIGLLMLPVVLVLQFVLPIVAAVAANKGTAYRYPLTLRFIP